MLGGGKGGGGGRSGEFEGEAGAAPHAPSLPRRQAKTGGGDDFEDFPVPWPTRTMTAGRIQA